ncbi:HelD family protein [Geodermatophilus sp. SYSU D00525]
MAIGRFDRDDGEVVYIGKHLITDEERNPLVVNWQTDFARPYFEATYDDTRGLLRRRKFRTERNTVQDFEDVVFEDLARRVGELTGLEASGIDDTVLRDLEQDRTGEMRDIVQTIHSSQYRLVRAPLEQLLVVQGGPGTGKTAVALHRVSWLLFNHRDRLSAEQVLVIGPNPTFTRYIRQVLPGLGDVDVVHRDLRGLGPTASTGRLEEADTARLKGDGRMAGLLQRALRQRVRVPDRLEELAVESTGSAARFTRQELQLALIRYLASPTYVGGRTGLRAWMTEEMGRRTAGSVSPTQIDAAVERLWPSLTPQAFVRDLLASRERLLAAAGDDFTAGDVGRLLRAPAERLSDETWTDADVALLDEADALVNGSPAQYRHIVVDEAQDLTPMQLRAVRRRSVDGSMTLVGDLAQSTGVWARDSWDDVTEALQRQHPVEVEELAFGYRVPQQVFEFAARLLPEAAPGVTPPRVVRQGPEEPGLAEVNEEERVGRTVQIAQDRAAQGLFVGIVCPDSIRPAVVEALTAKNVRYSDAGKGALGASINLVSPQDAKGLEFDSVVVVEPEAIVEESERGLRMLYVALTRTTRFLDVVHAGRALPLSAPESDDRADAVISVTEHLPLELQPVAEIVDEHLVPSPTPSGSPATLPGSEVDRSDPVVHSEDQVGEAVLETAEDAPVDHSASTQLPSSTALTGAAPVVDGGLDDIAALVVRTVAARLADTIRGAVPPANWPRLLDGLRRELGVSADELLQHLDD